MLENGARYRQVTLPRKKTVCGVSLEEIDRARGDGAARLAAFDASARSRDLRKNSEVLWRVERALLVKGTHAKTLCGEILPDGVEPSGDSWMAIRDPEIMGEEYRPCPSCAAAYKPMSGVGRRRPVWEEAAADTPGAQAYKKSDGSIGWAVRRMVVTHQPLSERMPLNVSPDGSTPDAAERAAHMAAHLGRVLPDVRTDDAGDILDDFLWTFGAQVVHVGVRRGDVVFAVCRMSPYSFGKAAHPEKGTVSCPGCKSVMYRPVAGVDERVVSSAARLVMDRALDDPHRYRPVAGVDEKSQDPRQVVSDPDRLRAAREQQMMRGLGVMDGSRAASGFRKYAVGDREIALQAWAAEALAGAVTVDGEHFASGWSYVRASGRMPDAVWSRMTREERRLVLRGWSRRNLEARNARGRRDAREDKAALPVALAVYRDAVREGAQCKPQRGRPSNPYPKPGGVFAEFRDKRTS